MHPSNPIAAASHADPYPYYRQLLAGPTLYFDPDLRLWIASRAAVVREVLASAHCLVRPIGEAVPKAIAGSAAGAVYSRLIRMNDGPGHACPKAAIGRALAALDLTQVADRAGQCASALAISHALPDGAAITRWSLDLPTCVVAGLLGLGHAELRPLAQSIADFVRCLGPLASPEQLAAASEAAHALTARFTELMQASRVKPDGLLGDVCKRSSQAGPNRRPFSPT